MNEGNDGSGLIKANYILAIILCIPIVSMLDYFFGGLDIAVIIISIIILNKKTYMPKAGTILMIISSIFSLIGIIYFYLELPEVINKIVYISDHHIQGENIQLFNAPLLALFSFLSFGLRIAAIIVYSMYRKPANK
ncbi:hypothetical protein DY120_01590 [Apilactobacillus micheneri]|uniref:Uncharacterized protein n=1 Tax=Apilactobacillus micheneri TaxID=1899430 RepID=A0ABY2Z0T2_9LACO|nr:hypothetical protein [Apilactobacillus micheneri]TPR26414.1 hypothetical protein DY114_01590 [Apilactobacillus micheneri]TPR27168.1 hypothetical protein DY111_01590 [Apilactobacillus micheneri]TPR27415.1 hypothetical protein DY113_06540 [Apilactobacillus micheneri]TPR31931.1 hypothetical protein DY117_01590 [Apilactobacillus micheneri]TPR32335.1 hypothetical protein DY120_01590 [Apilactobacillus micheneri]